VVIQSSSSAYCIYSPLNVQYSGSNDYYCIDSDGHIGKTVDNPGDVGYCTATTFVCPAVR
jgi:hypothetical protein